MPSGVLTAVAIAAGALLFARESAVDRSQLQTPSPEWTAVRALQDSVSRLGLRVQATEARRRVDSAIQGYSPGQAPRVIVLGGGNAAILAPMTDSLVGALPFPAAPAIRPRLALVEAPAGWAPGRVHVHSFTILPGATPDPGCTAVRVVYPDSIEKKGELWLWQRLPWDGAVGPCWYLANFGEPGPAIREWLDARYWDVAGVVPPHPRRSDFGDNFESAPNLFYRILGDLGGMYAGSSATLQGCASDKPILCEAALFGSPYSPGLLPEGIVGTERVSAYALGRSQSLTGMPSWASRELLAMMVEDLGPARFAAFWTSQAPVAKSFQAAAGIPFAEWYRDQLRRELRQAGFPDPGDPIFWPSAIGLLVLALGATLWGVRRRQVR